MELKNLNNLPFVPFLRVSSERGSIFFILLSTLIFSNAAICQGPLKEEVDSLLFDSSEYIFDLPHNNEEARNLLHGSKLTKYIEGRKIKMNEAVISVYDYLNFLRSKISKNEEIVVKTESGYFLLRDLGAQVDLKEKELINTSIVRDENNRIVKIYINPE